MISYVIFFTESDSGSESESESEASKHSEKEEQEEVPHLGKYIISTSLNNFVNKIIFIFWSIYALHFN